MEEIKEESKDINKREESKDINKREDSKDINKRYESIAWGCIFILVGILFLIPGHGDLVLLGIGAVLVGLNIIRYRKGIPTSGLTIVIGIIAIFYSILSLLRLNFPRIGENIFPIFLIAIGIYFIIVSIKRKKPKGIV